MKLELDMFFLYGSTILPECILILSLFIILIIDLTITKKDITWLYLISLTSLLISIIILLFQYKTEPVISFLGSLETDSFNRIFRSFIELCSILCIPLSIEYIKCIKMPIPEFLIFILTATIGAMFLCGANDLVTIFVSLECLSLCSYLLCGYTKRDIRSNEAAIKYLLIGGTSSSILAYGFSWLYGLSGGETNIEKIVNGLLNAQMINSSGTFIAFICVFVGLGFKLSIVPFHQWTPDIYEGSPTPVVAFLSVTSKIAGLALTTKFLNILFVFSPNEWKTFLEIFAILSMILGNLVAITQTSMKRMLAYSSISQIGYILIGVIIGNLQGYTSMTIYVFFYIFMNLGTFASIILFSLRTGTDNIRDYAGLYIKDPFLSLSLTLCLLSLGGLPPLTGFFGKLYLFWCGWQSGFYFLVFIGLITSVISLYYYLKIMKLILNNNNNNEMNPYTQTYIIISSTFFSKNPIEFIMIFCALGSTFLGVFINPIFSFFQDNLSLSIFFINN